MRTSIRQIRKRRGMTLKELALRVGTTPQTVQRLETANMTVSTDWLERIAQALDVRPIDLLEGGGSQEISFLGLVDTGGRLVANRADEQYSLDIAARDPVAVSLTCKLGPYDKGDTLIGSRYFGEDWVRAIDRDCIASLKDGQIWICRIVASDKPNAVTVVPLEQNMSAISGVQLDWAAPIIMAVRFFH
ncbi:MAG: helix-turn-helix domain-containing protein [Alphaproteobacteria bacterium]